MDILDLNLRKKVVKFYILSIALYGAEVWTLRKLVLSALEVFMCGDGGKMEWRSWPDRVKNEKYCVQSRRKGKF